MSVKIEWRKLRVFRRLDELEAANALLKKRVGLLEQARVREKVAARAKAQAVKAPEEQRTVAPEVRPEDKKPAGAPSADVMKEWFFGAEGVTEYV